MIKLSMLTRCCLAVAFITSAAFAQKPGAAYAPLQPIPVGDILLTLPSSHIAAVHTWEIKFSHRFNQSIDEGEGVHSLFGLDSGANVAIGVSYVPIRDLQLALLRSNVLDTYELSGKYVVTQQARSLPFSSALRAGADLRTDRSIGDRTSFFAQAIVSRQFGSRVDVYALPTFITKAGRAASGDQSVALFDHAFNVPVGLVFQMQPGLSVVAEVIPPNRDLADGVHGDPGWSIGIKRALGGHLFEILLTNNNGMTTDQYITSTFNGVPFDSGDIRLGFNIERRFGRGAKR